jgi:hypothetical protein
LPPDGDGDLFSSLPCARNEGTATAAAVSAASEVKVRRRSGVPNVFVVMLETSLFCFAGGYARTQEPASGTSRAGLYVM